MTSCRCSEIQEDLGAINLLAKTEKMAAELKFQSTEFESRRMPRKKRH